MIRAASASKFPAYLWSAGIVSRASNSEACTRNSVKYAHLQGIWLATLKADLFRVLRIATLIVPLPSKRWQFLSATTNSLISANSATQVPSTPLLHRAAAILPACYLRVIMWILHAVPYAVMELWQDRKSVTTILTRTATWRPAQNVNKVWVV